MKKIIKGIYGAVPFKKQLFSIIRLFKPSENIYRHLHFKGAFKVQTSQDSFFKINHSGYQIENDLFWTGLDNWEKHSLKLWKELSGLSSVILDIGANTGIYSLLSGSVNKEAKIFAFEPLVHKQLSDNVQLNDFNITVEKIAASNKDGEAIFYTHSTDFSYTASLNKNHQWYDGKLEIKVPTKTLDSFCEENSLIPDLVKIDVERHEPEVIEGFINTIRQHLPTLLIEVLDDETAFRVRDQLKGTPYQYYSINETKESCKKISEVKRSEDYNILACTEEIAKKLKLLS